MNNKDLILTTIISNPNRTSDTFFTAKSLKEYLFPDLNIDQVDFLINSIIVEKPELLEIDEKRFEKRLKPTGLVKEFLENGGFTKIESELSQFNKIKTEKENVEFEKSIIDLRLKKWQLKTFWPIFIFAIITCVFGVYNFINNLSSSRNITKQEAKIEQMESELKTLKTSISNQKTINSLKSSRALNNEKNIEELEDK